MANIELVELTKHYKQGKTVVRALDGVTLSITAGEFVSVVGRSGSGKTTLLDLVGLLLRPTSGRVVIDGVDTSTSTGRMVAGILMLSQASGRGGELGDGKSCDSGDGSVHP